MLRKTPTRIEMKSDNEDMAEYERVRDKKYAEQKARNPSFKPPGDPQLNVAQRIGLNRNK